MKKTSTRLLLVFFMLLNGVHLWAQDTAATLPKDAFLSVLRAYHPILKQADLQVRRAGANVLQARGAFDPAVEAGLNRKTFDGKMYYSYFNPQITIPTWYGIDIKAGAEEIFGDRVTSEATLGQTSYIGVKIPANNLLFDSRRATLRQAQTMREASEAERALIINDLLFDALGSYWNWVREYQLYQMIVEAVQINEERMQFVVTEYEQGSRPAIDTTEALAQLQSFYLQQNNAWLAFQNAGLELSNYMWRDANQPFEWNAGIIPSDEALMELPDIPSLEQLIIDALNDHPKLLSVRLKGDVLQTEQKLKAQSLIPKLSLNANLLSRGYGVPDEISIPLLENNYKLGVDFKLPLLMREARGAYQSARLKRQENDLDLERLGLQVENKVKAYYNEVIQLRQQLEMYEQVLSNNVRMFNGEKIRFDGGESTVFLLNARENKLLETRLKLTELRAKSQKSYAGLLWAAGVLQ